MRERSQKDAMRAAVRGDIERSRARQQGSPIAQPDDDRVADRIQPVPETPAPEPVEPEAVEPEPVEPEPAEPQLVEPEAAEPEPAEPQLVEPEAAEPEPEKRKPRSSIFSLLFRRR